MPEVQELIVHLLRPDLILHFPLAAFGAASRAQTPVSVDAHLPRAVPAAGVIAHEVAVVILGRRDADGVFQLRRDDEGAEDLAATVAVGADDPFDRHLLQIRDEAFEGEGMLAVTAPEGEARAFFEADRVWCLAF